MNSHQQPWNRAISRADLAALTGYRHDHFRFLEPTGPSETETVLRGDVRHLRFRSGLAMHCSDTLDVCNLTTQVVQEAGTSFFLFLEGTVDVRLGDRSFTLGAPDGARGRQPLQGTIINCAERDVLTRMSAKGWRIRNVVVTLPQDWCDTEPDLGSADERILRRFCATHLASASWTPSPRIVSLAEQILRPPPYQELLQRLYIESLSLEIAGEALSCLASEAGPQQTALRTRDYERLRAIAEQLSSGGSLPGSIEEIARDAGMSSSSLQRLFRAAFGITVYEFIRSARLDEARRLLMQDGVSVSEAAYRAGYSSAANFATAFKRRFGISPKHVRA
ncbi:helix-turn-helix transcriptional regulator [Microvirga roseola]|uniref:helix-turn-helix transcriptional regulator n=1 Tax=Microvirga roseola TaxID=2883126 RepID=UPI001E4E807C|nr:helix-turn-helix transcriptional regulator [Microvirga roseola]